MSLPVPGEAARADGPPVSVVACSAAIVSNALPAQTPVNVEATVTEPIGSAPLPVRTLGPQDSTGTVATKVPLSLVTAEPTGSALAETLIVVAGWKPPPENSTVWPAETLLELTM